MKSKVTGEKEHVPHRDRSSSLRPAVELENQGPLLDLKRILVPIDFSPTSLRTLRSVVPFARKFGASLCLVNVIERAEFSQQNTSVLIEETTFLQSAKEHLVDVLQTEVAGLVKAEAHIRIGRPFLEIIAFARLHEVDLIVIGPYGESHLGQTILGSTAEKVLRHAPCPVLALHEREHHYM
jgi:nucleotide-binding universal stress UspA family protein